MSGPPSRLRTFFRLARISNVPTVWTNVLAGVTLSAGTVVWPQFVRVAIGISLLYTGGMFLNDACDRQVDAERRPDRPIPAGHVRSSEVFVLAAAQLVAGIAITVGIPPRPSVLVWTILLVSAIVYYDIRHKRDRYAPLVMGLCRTLVYCVAAAASFGVSRNVLIAGVLMGGYVVMLTQIARRLPPERDWLVGSLIAGIALLDAVVIGFSSSTTLALFAVAGFGLTLAFQRWVPGT